MYACLCIFVCLHICYFELYCFVARVRGVWIRPARKSPAFERVWLSAKGLHFSAIHVVLNCFGSEYFICICVCFTSVCSTFLIAFRTNHL